MLDDVRVINFRIIIIIIIIIFLWVIGHMFIFWNNFGTLSAADNLIKSKLVLVILKE